MTDSNVTGQAYAFLAMTPITPGAEDALRAYLEQMRTNDSRPLNRIGRTHMARFVIVKDFHNDPTWKQRKPEHLAMPYLIFSANLDGDLDSYLDELCDKLAVEAKEIWGRCVGCPEGAKGAALKRYLKHNQIDTGIFYTPYGGATVKTVKTVLAQRDKLIRFAQTHQGADPAALQAAFVEEFGG